MEPSDFRHRLENYSHEIAVANSEAGKAFLFLEFVRNSFRGVDANTPHRLYPDLERHIKSDKTVLIKGRVDAFLGNVIIEFEGNLKERKVEEATLQLKRYTAILWNNKGIIDYLCIATDGLQFLIFRPRSKKTEEFIEQDIELQKVDSFDIRNEDTGTIYKRFDRYLLYQALVPPTSEDIVDHFGSKSVILSDCMDMLSSAWEKIKDQANVMYQEWAKYLSIVYGSGVDNKQLFLKHTYLATVAKLMVYSYYQENTLPTSKEIINRIITGEVFKEHGIENFLVEDFFSWIAKTTVNDIGIKITHRILDGLERFDLTKLNEDIFKELYQQLVDPEERHDLGEYYTPDWLAEMIVRETVKNADLRVLDPSCGSGTFLASVVRHKMTLMKNLKPADRVKKIIDTVFGMDIHPLAILISKANYLMSLGEALTRKEGTIALPIYMSDSVLFPVPKRAIATFSEDSEEVYTYRVDKQSMFILPKSLIEAESADYIIDNIKEFALKKLQEPNTPDTGFANYLSRRFGVTKDQLGIVLENVKTLVQLIRQNKDSIHPFILKNIYKPSTIGKFDVIVGNPPWLSYRYVKSLERQSKLKEMIIQDYVLLEPRDEKLMTHMEEATLFFVRCSDVYLKDHGIISFVLPRSVFTGDHHAKFRDNSCKPAISYYLLFDLEKNQRERVSPLFSVETCVVFGKKGGHTEYPIPTRLMVGRLPYKNSTLPQVKKLIEEGKFLITDHKTVLTRIGERVSWNYDTHIQLKSSQSPYMELFRQGATIVPRSFWFAEIVPHGKFGGGDLAEPYLESSKRSLQMAKKEYKGAKLSGKVESDYIFSTLLGSDLLPFCTLPSRLIVIPASVENSSYLMLTKDSTQARGHKNMHQWLVQAEAAWKKGRADKAEKMNIYDWLDYSHKLSKQDPTKRWIVLYNTSGRANLISCLVDSQKASLLKTPQNNVLKSRGFIIEHTTYYYYPKSRDEAYYITAVLNSNFVFTVLRKIKAARHIHKKIWELPIPEYDPANKRHVALSDLGRVCAEKAEEILKEELERFTATDALETGTIGTLRKKIKSQIEVEINQINGIVATLLQ